MSIPQKLIDDFVQLRECLIVIQRDYNTYNELYSDQNIPLLSRIAPTFFTDVAEIFQRDWMLQIVKLMDPAVTRVLKKDRENLNIQLINQQLETESLLTNEIREITKSILNYGELLKPARHRSLAHRDRECYFDDIVMGATTDDQLNDFMQHIQGYSDLVGIQLGLGPLDFLSSGCDGDVFSFLQYLRKLQLTKITLTPNGNMTKLHDND